MRIVLGVAGIMTGVAALGAAVMGSEQAGWWSVEGSAEAIDPDELSDHPAERDLTLRRVVAGENVDADGDLSPGGGRRAFTDWDTGNLVLEDLETGERRRLTEDGAIDEGGGFALGASFAPDGQRVAMIWMDNSGPDQVRVVDVESGEVRRIFQTDDEWFLAYPASAWTPDGEAFVVSASSQAGGQYLALMDATTGELQVLRGEREGAPSPVAVSPDGEWVAYFLDEENDEEGDSELRRLHMTPVDGGPEVATDVVAPNGSVAGWLTSGGPLFYQTGRGGIMTLVAQSMDGPEATSAPRAVKRDLVTPYFMGGVDGGLVFSQTLGGQRRIRLFKLDEEAGELVQRGGPTPGPPSEWHHNPQWTDGGATLVYTVNTPGEGGRRFVVFRSPSTGDERRVSLSLSDLLYPEVTEDGSLFVGSGSREGGPSGQRKSYLIEIEDGVARDPIPLNEPGPERCLGLRAAGDEIICWVYGDSDENASRDRLVGRSLAIGEDEVLRTAPEGIRGMSLSPTRDEVVVERDAEGERVVEVLDLRSDDRQELWRSPTDQSLMRAAWAADGESVHFLEEGSEKWRFHVVDREGRNPRDFALPDGLRPRVGSGELHPDNSTLALSTQEGSTDQGEFWVIENLPDEVR